MITISKLNNSIVFRCAIFWGPRAERPKVEGRGYGPRAEGGGTQTPKYFTEIKCPKSLQKAEAHLEHKRTSARDFLCEYI